MAEPKVPVKSHQEIFKRPGNQPHLPGLIEEYKQMQEGVQSGQVDPTQITGRGSGLPIGAAIFDQEMAIHDARAAKIGIRKLASDKFVLYLRDSGRVLWVSSSEEKAREQYDKLVNMPGYSGTPYNANHAIEE